MRRRQKQAGGKYHAIKTTIGDITFDSKGEAMRYQELMILLKAGAISDFQRQVKYELAPAVVIGGRKRPALRYIADFVYFDTVKQAQVVEDFKGKVTPEYRIKRHLMKSVHGIDIFESKAA